MSKWRDSLVRVSPMPEELLISLEKSWCESMGVKHKFGAKRTETDGIKFDSKLEARYYSKLKMAKEHGDLLFFLRQVPFHLPGGIKYVVDFVEFWEDGEVKFTDVKGVETKEFVTKKKIVESLYPIEINVVKKV